MTLRIKRAASTATDPARAVQEIYAGVSDPEAALTIFYCAPTYDRDALAAALVAAFGADAPVIGCTTAGEIAPTGYLEGALTAVSLAGAGLIAHVDRIDELRSFELERGSVAAARALEGLSRRGARPDPSTCFAFLLADGLSLQEEALVSSLYHNLDGIQLCGGSAADGTNFGATWLYHGGKFHTDCAVLTLVSSPVPFRVFKTEHFVPGTEKLVVTGADPARRVVTEINGEPAGTEYARLLGLETSALTPMVFAAYPVVVNVGGTCFVRSIQKVNDDGSLTFFCAIDEGIVLTIARGVDMVRNLEQAFAAVASEIGPPQVVLGCDCILRFIETGQRQCRDRIGEIMAANNVVGFATYGEQYNAMHVNQTFTAIALGAG